MNGRRVIFLLRMGSAIRFGSSVPWGDFHKAILSEFAIFLYIIRQNGLRLLRVINMKNILFSGCTLDGAQIKQLYNKGYNILSYNEDHVNQGSFIEHLRECDGFIHHGNEIVTGQMLKTCPRLRVISFAGTGYEKYIDVKSATELGIAVTNTRGANADSVAEFGAALILNAVKSVCTMANSTKLGKWTRTEGRDLKNMTLGVIGLGEIGARLCKIMKLGFNMNILYYSRSRKSHYEKELGLKYVTLPELLQTADVTSINATLTNDSRNMIGEKEIAMMKPNAILINTSRAEIVNGNALKSALEKNRLAFAAFDCFYTEPVLQKEEDKYGLLELPDNKFMLTPHVAYYTKDAILNMTSLAVQNTIDLFDHNDCSNTVNEEYKVHLRNRLLFEHDAVI